MKNFKRNSIKKQNNSRSLNYKAISLASLSTLALTLTLGDASRVHAVMNKVPGVGGAVTKAYRSSGSVPITRPTGGPVRGQRVANNLPGTVINKGSSGIPGMNPAFKNKLNGILAAGNKTNAGTHTGTGAVTHKTTTTQGTQTHGVKTNSVGTQTDFDTPNTNTTGSRVNLAGSQSLSGSRSSITSNSSVGTQHDVADNHSQTGSQSNLSANHGIVNEGFDNVSLASNKSTASGASNDKVNSNKKGLTTKQKAVIGGVGAVGIATALGLGLGLGLNKTDSSAQTTAAPDEVPVPKAPVNSNKVVTSGMGYLYTDE